MTVEPSWTTVREKAEELKSKILKRSPKVDVEYADWSELTGTEWRRWEHRGFPAGHPSVHVYMLIRGDLASGEKAAVFAENEASRIWEESSVTIQVAKTNHVYCLKSRPLMTYSFEPGKPLNRTTFYSEQKDGVTFLCWVTEPHEHEWARLKPSKGK